MHRHIHLDTTGGIAGDMFVAALLDCLRPASLDLASLVQPVLGTLEIDGAVQLQVEQHNDGVLSGVRFTLEEPDKDGGEDRLHHHTTYADIRDGLGASGLDDAVKSRALEIFALLAQAEAEVHGVAVEEVTFHEVGALDSIVDIVLAAWLIVLSEADSWSVSSLPLGSGQVLTAHGALPVPVPAVTSLLKGYDFHDDGIAGERITPTGAAILRHLAAGQQKPESPMRLEGSGYGFGSRRLPGLSNVLRATAFETGSTSADLPWDTEQITELCFEVDDQTAEDLAHALDLVRKHAGVADALVYQAAGKKGRTVTCVRVLCSGVHAQQVKTLCFDHTSTLGIREEAITRHMLRRIPLSVEIAGREYGVKLAQRPSGELSMKPEMDDLAAAGLDYTGRSLLRGHIEQAVWEQLAEGDTDQSGERDDDT